MRGRYRGACNGAIGAGRDGLCRYCNGGERRGGAWEGDAAGGAGGSAECTARACGHEAAFQWEGFEWVDGASEALEREGRSHSWRDDGAEQGAWEYVFDLRGGRERGESLERL